MFLGITLDNSLQWSPLTNHAAITVNNSAHVAEINDDTLMKIFSKMKENISKINTHSLEDKHQLYSEINVTKQNSSQDIELKIKCETKKNLQSLKEEVIVLNQKLNTLNEERTAKDLEFTKIQKANERAQGELNNIQNIVIDLKNSNIPLEGGIENVLNSIRTSIEQLHTKSDNCMMKNLMLKAEIEKNRKKLGSFVTEKENCIKTLQSLKETAKSMKEEYLNKEKSRDLLKSKYEKLSKGNKRSIYTKRIMEIINNVDKQKIEIKKILEDTRQIQKQINTLEAQLERSFSVADETLFKDAKKDDQAKKAYKLLALLHSECNTIVSLVNDTGTIAREIVDLEDHIEVEKAKRIEETLKRIQLDLTVIQSEKINK
ncbi:Coiled-coil domain-containing protein 22 homolog [Eumeta japonica]|uniref:Coiled-coil domain-containing protein 22 homolog n=1 Tax=Eumeta variegata TaxID=151549 RepID=A0A4C1X914_EUMVA|nr:Coiled-coil domain-containing protein 22 homolog [Eumeta japonica]